MLFLKMTLKQEEKIVGIIYVGGLCTSFFGGGRGLKANKIKATQLERRKDVRETVSGFAEKYEARIGFGSLVLGKPT